NLIWSCVSTIQERYLPQSCSSSTSDLNSNFVSNPVSGSLYTFDQRLWFLEEYKNLYDSGIRVNPERTYHETGVWTSINSNTLKESLTNAFMLKLFTDELRRDGMIEELIPKIPKITLQGEDTPEIARNLLIDYFGDYYDGSILWE